ncbi:bifunctional glycosyltransferase/CDP-glycerol:glycerophosphate glycerophosphotransferase [Apilactobacillus timberlakei]|uniref:bifunctional glycosyltransferase/CDP-glycerol:glycerophosphate glycerophosphotransferase n=1 Tax=Apilactobacillus timberlakei TaxID=2008380 RepID=UPI00112ADFF7|nr:bifunctional glycosyltransferase/CDP-glycerol:glycerophosphate glycerophosphotransferase [Apilactobacillus timberlakei]TPR21763.1 glycosyltransferase [Apilactobacillus timberlakei]TPR23009.1 glycosyltransferase [Apilactobacillus timberlakei]
MNKPYLSVIVACYNVQDYVAACLESIAQTDFPKENMEVLMIDDGSTDDTSNIVDQYAKKYDSFKALHKDNGGISSTRNYGIKHAQGEYIAFVDGDDLVPADGYSKLSYNANQNNADVVVGFVKRFDKNRYKNSYLHSFAIHDNANHTNIYDNHDLLYDTTVWNKLYRRNFLLDNDIKFIEGIIYEDIPFTLQVHLKSKVTDIIEDVVYKWRWRESNDSITQSRSALSNFQSRLDALNMCREMLKKAGQGENSPLFKDFKYKILFLDIFIFIENIGDNEESYIYKAQEMVYKFLRDWNLWDSKPMNNLPVKQQVVYYALRHGEFNILDTYTYRQSVGHFKKGFHGLSYKYYMPEIFDYSDEISSVIELGSDNAKINQKMTNYKIDEDGQFIGRGFFIIRNMRLSKHLLSLGNVNELFSAKLVNIDNDKEMKININRPKTSLPQRLLNARGKWTNARYQFSFDINDAIEKLGTGTWKVLITDLIANKYLVSRYISSPNKKTKNKFILPYVNEDKHTKISARFNSVNDFVINSNSLYQEDIKEPIISNVLKSGKNLVFDVINTGNNHIKAELIMPDETNIIGKVNENNIVFDNAGWNTNMLNQKALLVMKDSFTNSQINYVFDQNKPSAQINTDDNMSYTVFYNNRDGIEIIYENTPFITNSINLNSSNLLKLSINIPDYLKNENLNINNSKIEMISSDKTVRKVFDNSNNDFQLNGDLLSLNVQITNKEKNQLNILSGKYIFKVYLYVNDKIKVFRLLTDESHLVPKQSLSFNGKDKIYYQIQNSNNNDLELKINQPFSNFIDSKKIFRSLSYSLLYPFMRFLPLRKIMVFDCYWSSKFDSNERLMYEYMQKSHPEIKTVWFFKNTQTPINGEATKVKVNSFMYWYYLAVSKYIIQNTNMPNRYAKRKGQIEVETLHGTFLKHMGFDEPHFKFASHGVQSRFAKRNRRWDYMVVPSDYMGEIATKAFDYDQKLIKSGFPRNDELYTNNNDGYINSVKNRLGIPLDKKVILYAPTYREDEGFDFQLNLDKMQAKLSDKYVLLVRLHYFVAHSNSFYSNPGFVFDVSDYNNINDLYLISDAMITDYSSVMFDYAHLKRPMLFYAYDKDWYLDDENRGVYLDYDKEIPGPIIKTEDELINRIQHLDAVADNYHDKLIDFYDKFAQYGQNGDASKEVVEKILSTKNSELDQVPEKRLISRKFGHLFKVNYLQASILNRLSNMLTKKNIIIFESFFGTQYSDNPKAIYEYMKKNYPEYKMYWNVNREYVDYFKENNIPYVIRFSYSGILKQAKAKYFVTNVRRPFRWKPGKDTKLIQTWHGTPLKTLAADVNLVTMPGINAARYHKDVFKDNRRWDKMIAPNMYSANIMQRAFRMNANQMMLDGYPRNDVLVNSSWKDIASIKEDLNISADKKVILYAPTWRDNEYVKANEFTAKLHLDLAKIKSHFGNNVIVLVRTHYLIANNLDLSDYSDIALNVSLYPDIAELYLISDVLITDYSSVMFDYAVLKRPMIFFTYDLDDYANEIRGFYFDFVKDAPGKIVKTNDGVIDELDHILSDNWTMNDNYKKFIDKFTPWMDGKSSERAVNQFLNEDNMNENFDDNISKYNLQNEMKIHDGASLWNSGKDFTDHEDVNFSHNYNDKGSTIRVIKVMQLIDPDFKEKIGMKYVLIQLNGKHLWVNIEDLY